MCRGLQLRRALLHFPSTSNIASVTPEHASATTAKVRTLASTLVLRSQSFSGHVAHMVGLGLYAWHPMSNILSKRSPPLRQDFPRRNYSSARFETGPCTSHFGQDQSSSIPGRATSLDGQHQFTTIPGRLKIDVSYLGKLDIDGRSLNRSKTAGCSLGPPKRRTSHLTRFPDARISNFGISSSPRPFQPTPINDARKSHFRISSLGIDCGTLPEAAEDASTPFPGPPKIEFSPLSSDLQARAIHADRIEISNAVAMQDVAPNTALLTVAHASEPLDSVPARSHSPAITTRENSTRMQTSVGLASEDRREQTRYGRAQGPFPGRTRYEGKPRAMRYFASEATVTPDYERWKD
ncbi:hypothetical protein D9611_014211 [Ephemerocybe angulata]|uniref:Uncharacterized protein n=1 Tax=Ephemerocybe angulata TaxID=980116 RepID=A0A8H5FIX8_9AGAR|nr:hypothetical protein D9611_014211 [Tulosesus angulatus]